jgi:(p)ppGpp synthase/HD superfamily hydrolase
MSRLQGLDADSKKSVLCALVGHSRIQTYCFGYFNCARCCAQVGDSLGGVYPQAESVVIVGHDCKTCRKNAKELTWRDTLLSPDPFKRDSK